GRGPWFVYGWAVTVSARRCAGPGVGRSWLLTDDRGRALAEHELLDFAGGRLGQLLHEGHPLRRFEVSHPAAGELADLIVCGRCARLEDHEGMRRLPPLLVRDADDGHLLYGGMAEQDALDLDRGDVLAAADDDVLDPVSNLDVAVGLDDRCIAGVEPAV